MTKRGLLPEFTRNVRRELDPELQRAHRVISNMTDSTILPLDETIALLKAVDFMYSRIPRCMRASILEHSVNLLDHLSDKLWVHADVTKMLSKARAPEAANITGLKEDLKRVTGWSRLDEATKASLRHITESNNIVLPLDEAIHLLNTVVPLAYTSLSWVLYTTIKHHNFELYDGVTNEVAKAMLRRRMVTKNHLMKALGTTKGTIEELEATVAATEGAEARVREAVVSDYQHVRQSLILPGESVEDACARMTHQWIVDNQPIIGMA
jgi:hypothetical protein